jgi:hypothetical protein
LSCQRSYHVSSVTFAQLISCIICLLISFLYSLLYSFSLFTNWSVRIGATREVKKDRKRGRCTMTKKESKSCW